MHGLHVTTAVQKHDFTGAFLILDGDASVSAGIGWPRYWLGAFTPTAPILLRDFKVEADSPIVLPFSDEQLWRIEEMRGADDFKLELRVNGKLIIKGASHPTVNPQPYELRVDRDLWLRQLAAVERMAHFMVAVPALGDGTEGMASVVGFLRDATHAYRDNRDRDAATAIRRALDRFKTIVTIPSENSLKAVAAANRDEGQRWAAVYYALLGVLNAAPHGDPVAEKVEFDRRDGQAVIAIAMSLIGRHWD